MAYLQNLFGKTRNSYYDKHEWVEETNDAVPTVSNPHAGRLSASRRKPLESYAGKFAAKEAVMKALGTGIRKGLWFSPIEILNGPTGAPLLKLYRTAESLATEKGILQWQISISPTSHTVAAVVLALGLTVLIRRVNFKGNDDFLPYRIVFIVTD